MSSLRTKMSDFLVDWRDDLNDSWRGALDGAEPDLSAIGPDLTLDEGETIFPGRKGAPAPGAREDAHVFRALEGLRPSDVTAVVLGQDPYPRSSRATGRSFEQGDLPEWSAQPKAVADSLRRILQIVANFRTGENRYLDGDPAWASVVSDIQSAKLDIRAPRPFFDDWQQKGVLCLNAGLTLSRFQPEVQQAHFALWRPVVQSLLTTLATRKSRSVVFLLWGGVAQKTFKDLGILDAAKDAGTLDRVGVITHVHPNAKDQSGMPRFFEPPNTFTAANEKLVAIGGPKIEW